MSNLLGILLGGGSSQYDAPSGTPSIVVNNTKVISAGADFIGWNGRTHMAVRDGITICIYKNGQGHAINTDGELNIRFSNDYGGTWSNANKYTDGTAITGFPMKPTGVGALEGPGEPMVYLTSDGTLILHQWLIDYGVSSGGTQQSISSDGGKTWTTPSQVIVSGEIINHDLSFITDDYFLYDNTLYVVARERAAISPTTGGEKNYLLKTSDNGATWQKISDITDWINYPTYEAGLEYVAGHKITTLSRALNNVATYQQFSYDFGNTWTTPVDLTSQLGVTSRHRIYTRAHLQGKPDWWSDPVLICFCFLHQTPGESKGRKNSILISKDHGDTWSGPFGLDSFYEDGGYGDVIYNPLTGDYVVTSYRGIQLGPADVVQYNFNLNWV